MTMGSSQVLRARNAREFQALAIDPEATPVASRQFSRSERLLVRIPVFTVGGRSDRLGAARQQPRRSDARSRRGSDAVTADGIPGRCPARRAGHRLVRGRVDRAHRCRRSQRQPAVPRHTRDATFRLYAVDAPGADMSFPSRTDCAVASRRSEIHSFVAFHRGIGAEALAPERQLLLRAMAAGSRRSDKLV